MEHCEPSARDASQELSNCVPVSLYPVGRPFSAFGIIGGKFSYALLSYFLLKNAIEDSDEVQNFFADYRAQVTKKKTGA